MKKNSTAIRRQLLPGILFLALFPLSAVAGMLPEGITVARTFRPGYGYAVGRIQLTQGPVFIIHDKIDAAFQARNALPLYKGDTLITDDKGRLRFVLNDGSTMTLASHTKLVLTRSIYDPATKTRSSFLKMALGKARFLVKKFFKFKKSDFKVKTSTFVAGVRGSDFIITANADRAEVVTLEDTTLEIVSLSKPDAGPVILKNFQRTAVPLGQLPEKPQSVPAPAAAAIRESMSIGDDQSRPGEKPRPKGLPAEPLKKRAPDDTGRFKEIEPGILPGVMIHQRDLTAPPVPDRGAPDTTGPETYRIDRFDTNAPLENAQSEIEAVVETQRGDTIRTLPGLPSAPSR